MQNFGMVNSQMRGMVKQFEVKIFTHFRMYALLAVQYSICTLYSMYNLLSAQFSDVKG